LDRVGLGFYLFIYFFGGVFWGVFFCCIIHNRECCLPRSSSVLCCCRRASERASNGGLLWRRTLALLSVPFRLVRRDRRLVDHKLWRRRFCSSNRIRLCSFVQGSTGLDRPEFVDFCCEELNKPVADRRESRADSTPPPRLRLLLYLLRPDRRESRVDYRRLRRGVEGGMMLASCCRLAV